MTERAPDPAGAVAALWRYPVKSMLGEELAAVEVGPGGVRGDRAYALIDGVDGKVVTAKNPKKWPTMFQFSSRLNEASSGAPSLEIVLPDGATVEASRRDVDAVLSRALGREVTLAATAQAAALGERAARPAGWVAKSENYTPLIDGLSSRERVDEFPLPTGTFFDCAVVHLVTTATLDRLQRASPGARFDQRRFRPNLVVEMGAAGAGFDERSWIGRTLAIGDEVRIVVTEPTGRCVMTTLAQGDLPVDRTILRTIVQANEAQVGVYATVERGGTIRRGDSVRAS
jgi:uncharacterized protein YcbX